MNTYSLIGSSSAGSCFHAGSSDVIHSGSDVISSIFHSCIFVWRRVNMTDDGAGRRTSSYRTGWMAGAQIACSACSSPFTTNCARTFPTRTTCFGLTQYFTEIITYLATCFFSPLFAVIFGQKTDLRRTIFNTVVFKWCIQGWWKAETCQIWLLSISCAARKQTRNTWGKWT